MDCNFEKGFLVYKDKERDLVIACPHSGPALDHPTTRDDNSETVASLCWHELNGTLVISSMPRKRQYGIDFNRDLPPLKTALEAYNDFNESNNNGINLYEYRKKYAWVAKDEQDYETRLKIYQNFWAEVGKYNNIILVHRAFNRIKIYPSVMDFVTFSDKGIKKSLITELLRYINKKYSPFLNQIEQGYKKMIYYESQRFVADLISTYKIFNPQKFNGEIKDLIAKDMKKIQKYAAPYIEKRLKDNFTLNNYLEAVKNALNNAPPPEITVENTFDGTLALGPKRKLFPTTAKTIIEVESSHFMNLWYPKIAAEIIKDVYNIIEKRE
ncbi:MAG: hypothetical protein V1663_00895 [archaeon]